MSAVKQLRFSKSVRAFPWPFRLRRLGLGVLLGISLAGLTFAMLTISAVVVERMRSSTNDAALADRLNHQLTLTAAHLNDERSRTVLLAAAATTIPGLADAMVAQNSQQVLRLMQPLHRMPDPPLLGVVNPSGKLVAAVPATNLPLGQTGLVKRALNGRTGFALTDEGGAIAFAAAAPLRSANRVVGATLSVQRLDGPVLTSAAGELPAALIVDGRVVAASGPLRQQLNLTKSNAVSLVPPPNATHPGQLSVGVAHYFVATEPYASLLGGREAILAVGEPDRGPGSGIFALYYRRVWGLAVLAAIIAGLGGWLIGRSFGRGALALTDGSEPPSPLAGRELSELAMTLKQERIDAVRSRAVIDAIAEGVIVSDTAHHVILTNAAVRGLLGPNGSATAAAVASLLPADGRSEIRLRSRVLRSYSVPFVTDGGGGMVTVLRDATAERDDERFKNEFLSIVSHELRTPLTAIVGAADLLLDDEAGGLTPEQTRFLTTIRRNGDRLIALVNDLLDVSRLEAGRVDLDRQPVDLGALARSSVRSMASLFDQKEQLVTVTAADGVPPVSGDRRRIEQILANLLANAGQYTPECGHIRVEVAALRDEVVVRVADDGPGLTTEEQARVFEKFYRGGNATARRERGSGLGLAVVRSLVELHGGRVWVESAPNQGACFSVALPRATIVDD